MARMAQRRKSPAESSIRTVFAVTMPNHKAAWHLIDPSRLSIGEVQMNSRFWKLAIAASLIGLANASHSALAQSVAVQVRIVKVPDAVIEQLDLGGCKTEQPAG